MGGLAYRDGPWLLGLALRAGATQRRTDELAGMLQVAYQHDPTGLSRGTP